MDLGGLTIPYSVGVFVFCSLFVLLFENGMLCRSRGFRPDQAKSEGSRKDQDVLDEEDRVKNSDKSQFAIAAVDLKKTYPSRQEVEPEEEELSSS